jgi:hypothetical protein
MTILCKETIDFLYPPTWPRHSDHDEPEAHPA